MSFLKYLWFYGGARGFLLGLLRGLAVVGGVLVGLVVVSIPYPAIFFSSLVVFVILVIAVLLGAWVDDCRVGYKRGQIAMGHQLFNEMITGAWE